jgi:hypothetical protein
MILIIFTNDVLLNFGQSKEGFKGQTNGLTWTVNSSHTFDKDGIYDVSYSQHFEVVKNNGSRCPFVTITSYMQFDIKEDSCEYVNPKRSPTMSPTPIETISSSPKAMRTGYLAHSLSLPLKLEADFFNAMQ